MAGQPGDRALAARVRAAGGVHEPPRRGALARGAARACVGSRLREPLEHRRRVRALPAREDRPAVRPSWHRNGARLRLSPERRWWRLRRLPWRLRLTLTFAL